MFGQVVEIRKLIERNGLIEVCFAHPDGGSIQVPAWTTDFNGPQRSQIGSNPRVLFDPCFLIKIVEKLDFLAKEVIKPQQSCKEASVVRRLDQKFDSAEERSLSDGKANDSHHPVGDEGARSQQDGGRE